VTDFDAIVVGGGVAGCTAAFVLAEAGLDVLLVERGDYPGSKNMTGGRLYTHSLEKVIPGFSQEAPLERKIAKEKISFLTRDSATTLDFKSSRLGGVGGDSYVVLRSKFDRWLAGKAEAAGAGIVTGVRVDELLVKDGRICGVKAGEDEIESNVVILADGVNSLLAQQAGLKKELSGHQVAVGVKEIIDLPARTIEDRFNLDEGEGASWLLTGCTEGGLGGGFVYTNNDSISLGIVLTLSEVESLESSVPELLEKLKTHPAIGPVIKDGRTVEYSAHLVPEGGQSMVPHLYGDNVLVVGDAAGLVINVGYMVRGMDLAIASGQLAAQTVIEAKQKGDYSASTLRAYQEKLDASFVGHDMRTYAKVPAFLEKTPRMFSDYPEVVADLMTDLFVIDGSPARPLRKRLMPYARRVGYLNLAKDGLGAMGAL
jgi:electron transfer flavoprotein-quinone oxidoreductase